MLMHSIVNIIFLLNILNLICFVICFVVMSERLKEFETEMKRIKGKKNKQKGIAMNKDG